MTRRPFPLLALALSLAMPLVAAQATEPDPDATRFAQRLQAIDTDPERNAFAAYERLQARQAVQNLLAAKRKAAIGNGRIACAVLPAGATIVARVPKRANA